MAKKAERPTYAQRVMIPAAKKTVTGVFDYMHNGPKAKPAQPAKGGPTKKLKARTKR